MQKIENFTHLFPVGPDLHTGLGNTDYVFLCTSLDHRLDTVEGPVDLLASDDQRRSNTNHLLVRLLAKDSLLLQPLAVGTCGHGQFEAYPKPAATDLEQMR